MRTNHPEDFQNLTPASVDYEQLLHDRAESEAYQAEQRGYDVDEYWKRDKKLYEWSGGIGSVNWHIYAMGFKAANETKNSDRSNIEQLALREPIIQKLILLNRLNEGSWTNALQQMVIGLAEAKRTMEDRLLREMQNKQPDFERSETKTETEQKESDMGFYRKGVEDGKYLGKRNITILLTNLYYGNGYPRSWFRPLNWYRRKVWLKAFIDDCWEQYGPKYEED